MSDRSYEEIREDVKAWVGWHERAETAEAEVERLNEVVAGMDRELGEWQSRAIGAEAELCRKANLAGDYAEEADRLRDALQQIVDWTGLTPTNVLRMGVREFARRAVLATTEEPNP